ncbi:MAG: hypothetical protein ACLRMN_03365 [Mediterraneibacter gnavus]
MKKKVVKSLLISVIAGSLVFGLTACGGGSGKSEDTKKDNGDKVVLDVINYHVGTDYASWIIMSTYLKSFKNRRRKKCGI